MEGAGNHYSGGAKPIQTTIITGDINGMPYVLIYPLGNSDARFVSENNENKGMPLLKNASLALAETLKNEPSLFRCDETGIILHKPLTLSSLECAGAHPADAVTAVGFPLLSSVWRWFKEMNGENVEADIVFFATDQPGAMAGKDTIGIARLIDLWIANSDNHLRSASIVTITKDPSHLDMMSAELQNFFTSEKFTALEDSAAEILIFLGPGTPAINEAIILNAYETGARFYYLRDVFRENTQVVPLKEIHKLRARRQALIIKTFIQAWDYTAAAESLRVSALPFKDMCRRICSGLAAMVEMDFTMALKEAKEIPDDAAQPLRPLTTKLKETASSYLEPCESQDSETFLRGKKRRLLFLFDLLEIAMEQKRFQSQLALFFNIHENLQEYYLRLVTEHIGDWELKKCFAAPSGFWAKFSNHLKQNDPAYLADIARKNKPDGRFYGKVLGFCAKVQEEVKVPLQTLRALSDEGFSAFKDLKELRNSGCFGHGTEGLNARIVDDAAGGSFEHTVKELKSLCPDNEKNPNRQNFFAAMNHKLTQTIDDFVKNI